MNGRLKAKQAAREDFLPIMRELVRAYQALEVYDSKAIRTYGLTVPQADVIFSLGNTEGKTFKELGEATLITKGTLTGVVDRLEAKQLVRRIASEADRRSILVVLTDKGVKLFEKTFPKHIHYLKERWDKLTETDKKQASKVLKKIHEVFS